MSNKDILGKLLTLANPLHMMTTNENDYVIKKPIFSKNTGINELIGNSLVIGGLTIPAAFMVAALTNRAKHKKMLDAIDKSALKSLNSTRPVITPNSDIEYIDNLKTDSKNELAKINKLIESDIVKEASDDAKVHDSWTGAFLAGIPLFALPFSAFLGAKLAHKFSKKDIEQDLAERSIKMRDYQDKVDMDILKKMGLVKEATKLTRMLGDISDNVGGFFKDVADTTKKAVQNGEKLTKPIVTVPVASATLALLATAFGGAHILKKMDKNRKKVDFIEKKMLGENRSYETPEISLEFLANANQVDKGEIKQQIEDIPSQKVLEDKAAVNLLDNKLKEDILNEFLVPAGSKKEALF